jgi:hypothetical protein
MKTYQDLLAKLEKPDELADFLLQSIRDYEASEMYKWAVEGDAYARQKNTTILRYQKMLYTMAGKAVPDNFAANHKCASNFFSRFIIQENQYLLGNGVTFNNKATKDRLGKSFDAMLQRAGEKALACAVSYGFWNFDHLEVFSALEFKPFWDEVTGELKAGIRFWQIDESKPLRFTLYELDGFTEYIKDKGGIRILTEKQPYIKNFKYSEADGLEIRDGENYKNFPIIPLWANIERQSELVGLKSEIDAYDLIKSGFANDLDDASMIYWTITNAGGMDDVDLAKFLERLKTVKAATIEDDVNAEAHTIDVPYQSRETYLTRLENDMYNDAMALNVHAISAGNVTATAINAAYEALNNKVDRYEYCVTEFIDALLKLLGIDDEPTFVRSKLVNQAEETQMILSAAQYLDDETILKHLPFLSIDEVDDILDNLVKEESDRFKGVDDGSGTEGDESGTEENGKSSEEDIQSGKA